MVLFDSTFAAVLFCVICLVHILGTFTNGKCAKTLRYVNIGLHIILILPLVWVGVQLEEALLIYMISAIVYMVAALVEYKVGVKKR